jgi:hypothetical protein
MIDRWLSEMMRGGASQSDIVNALKQIGYKQNEANDLLKAYGFKESSSSIDPNVRNKIGFEYLDKHTIEANRATAKFNQVPSELRDAIGHTARSMTVFSNANVVLPALRGFNPNSVHTGNRMFDEIGRKLSSVSGVNVPPSTIARNARVMQSLMMNLEKQRRNQMKRFASGGNVPFNFRHFQMGKGFGDIDRGIADKIIEQMQNYSLESAADKCSII